MANRRGHELFPRVALALVLGACGGEVDGAAPHGDSNVGPLPDGAIAPDALGPSDLEALETMLAPDGGQAPPELPDCGYRGAVRSPGDFLELAEERFFDAAGHLLTVISHESKSHLDAVYDGDGRPVTIRITSPCKQVESGVVCPEGLSQNGTIVALRYAADGSIFGRRITTLRDLQLEAYDPREPGPYCSEIEIDRHGNATSLLIDENCDGRGFYAMEALYTANGTPVESWYRPVGGGEQHVYWEHDTTGAVVRWTGPSPEGPYGTGEHKLTHLQDAEGRRIGLELDAFDDGTIEETASFEYDDAGRPSVEEVDFDVDGLPDYRGTNGYDDAGRLKSFTSRCLFQQNGAPYWFFDPPYPANDAFNPTVMTYGYDDEGRVATRDTKGHFQCSNCPGEDVTFERDESDRLVSIRVAEQTGSEPMVTVCEVEPTCPDATVDEENLAACAAIPYRFRSAPHDWVAGWQWSVRAWPALEIVVPLWATDAIGLPW